MIELFATDKVRASYDNFRAFVEQELIPIELTAVSGHWSEIKPMLDKKREKARSLGLWAPHLPENKGGMGMSMLEFAQVSELLARTPFGHYCVNAQAPDIGNMELLEKYASEELSDRYLHPLENGEIRSCFSMTEPQYAGSNPVNMGTTAELREDKYVINGHKWFTTAADGASFAVVMAVTDPEASPYQRASMIIVPTDTEGFELVRNIPIMGDEGSGYHSHAEIKYNNCIVPASNLVGERGHGFALAQERLGPGRIHHCMRWIGICERAFDLMCKRAVTRELSAGSMLSHKQSIQHWIAETRVNIDAARYMVLHTAQKMDQYGTKTVRNEISGIKFYVANILMQTLDRAIQVHGALGITDETILSYWYRHERGARIYDGPDEVHKSAMARNILKQYKEQ
ncbi:MAG: acyl-CoA dehydrogenase family protein [Cyclobacteriaceae bacterium]